MGASIFAVIFLGEKTPPIYWVGVIFACTGILLIAYSGGDPRVAEVLNDEATATPRGEPDLHILTELKESSTSSPT